MESYKIVFLGRLVCSLVLLFSLSLFSLSSFSRKKGDFGIETGFGERIRDAYAKDGVGLRRR